MLAPVLEIYVVWHPSDTEGERISQELLDHFRGTTYSGLIGGAVEVFVRSASAGDDPDDVPRPLPCTAPLPYGIPHPVLTAVVLVAGTELAAAVQSFGRWHNYVAMLTSARTDSPERVGIYPVRTASGVFDGTALGDLVGSIQAIGNGAEDEAEFLTSVCRDLTQGIAQLGAGQGKRVKIFVSHTKRDSVDEEEQDAVSSLVRLVREVISDTRLDEFFDAHDLQPNEDWELALKSAAASGALLAIRTDLYSSRQWCQREVLIAKRNGVPVVVLDALTSGEERGSFLMDHVPRVPARQCDGQWRPHDVERTLNQLVDECLKRVLWRIQEEIVMSDGPDVDIDWWAPHAPEPLTFLEWLTTHHDLDAQKREPIIVLHPDPPLGQDEIEVLLQLASVASLHDTIEFLTPAGLAARGG